MTALMHNNLRFYTLRITESPEMAEKMARQFEIKFIKLNKYDQMELAFKIEMDGWETAFEVIDNY
jgi:hypothetical protein